jgi:hypothetical protein
MMNGVGGVLEHTPPYAFNQSEMKKNNKRKINLKVDMPTLP